VPQAVRAETERLLGSRVLRGVRVWGGYGPSATFRLYLADGRRIVFKGTYDTAFAQIRWALDREERVYRDLRQVIAPWAPDLYGSIEHADWHVLLLEDLGPTSVPPWTGRKATAAMHSYADFHASTLGTELPDWLPRRDHVELAGSWRELAGEPGGLVQLAELAGSQSHTAQRWLQAALSTLTSVSDSLSQAGPPYALLHLDTRSDNIRLRHGRLLMFDWPLVAVGPPEVDVAAFIQSIACEDGPNPEVLVRRYGERVPLRDDVLDAAVAAVAGFFACRAWREPIPGLPRLRPVQRCQLSASLRWASSRLALPEPVWVQAVLV
jgi:hypothetical protein